MRRLFIALQVLILSIIPAYAQEPDNTNRALDLLQNQVYSQPDDFSVACMPLANRSGTTQYNVDSPFPLASISKLLIFIEYARRVDAGLISLDEMVSIDVLNAYDLPHSDSNAHEGFFGPVRIRYTNHYSVGCCLCGHDSIQFKCGCRFPFGSPWADRLGQSLPRLTGNQHRLSPLNERYSLLMNNHETGRTALATVQTLSITQGEALFDLYLQDAEWRQAEVAHRSNHRHLFPDWEVQAAILEQFTAAGTAGDFLNVLVAIYDTDGPLSERTKQMVRDALRWRNNAYVDSMYSEYGSKLGFYSGGVITLVAYGHPHNGNPVISVAFLRNIPRRVYNRMLQQDSIGELAHWMNRNECTGLLDVLFADLPKGS